MATESKYTSVYVVSGWVGGVNDRVAKLLSLRDTFAKVVLVKPGFQNSESDEMLEAKPWPNPTGLLRILGLGKLRSIVDRYLYFPSTSVLFDWKVFPRLARSIEKDLQQGLNVTLVTAMPPHSFCGLGIRIKHVIPKVRWVIDWQDLWSHDGNYFYLTPKFRRNAVRRLETAAMKMADLNITTNSNAARVLIEKYGCAECRVVSINHHYEAGATVPHGPYKSTPHAAKIGFLGALFKPPRVDGTKVVEAIQTLRADGLNVELNIHGKIPPKFMKELPQASTAGIVEHGTATHAKSVARLSDYDYLLLVLGSDENSRAVMSIKLPHYMVSGKPTIAVVPLGSAVHKIVEQTGTGIVLDTESDWISGLKEILSEGYIPSIVPDHEAIIEFSWTKLQAQWKSALIEK